MAEYRITFTVGEECEVIITADSREQAEELFTESPSVLWQVARSIETRTDIVEIEEVKA